jgi:hypothetical protein
LVIEVDGGQHFEASQARRDERRTTYLEAQNLRVLRFTDREVLRATGCSLDAVFAAVLSARLAPTYGCANSRTYEVKSKAICCPDFPELTAPPKGVA